MELTRLNLGSGLKKLEGYINIDNRIEMSPDLLWDVRKGIPYPDNSIIEVNADNFLEHIEQSKVIPLMNEVHRVLNPEGVFNIVVPSTDGRGAFQDPYHVSFWNINSFLYYTIDDMLILYPEIKPYEILELRNTANSEQELKRLKAIFVVAKMRPVK